MAATAPAAAGSRCYGSRGFLTVTLDNPITGEHEPLDVWPVADTEREDELTLPLSESSTALFRGVVYGGLICLCFWIALAVVVVVVLV